MKGEKFDIPHDIRCPRCGKKPKYYIDNPEECTNFEGHGGKCIEYHVCQFLHNPKPRCYYCCIRFKQESQWRIA